MKPHRSDLNVLLNVLVYSELTDTTFDILYITLFLWYNQSISQVRRHCGYIEQHFDKFDVHSFPLLSERMLLCMFQQSLFHEVTQLAV